MKMGACNVRIVDGHLMGRACTKIPQAAPEGPEARAVQSPRSRMAKLPTLVSQGLLFVWPDENGWEKPSQTKPPLLPDEFNDPGFSTVTIQRDLFYGYDTLMENVSDPSHIDFAHHKDRDRHKVTFSRRSEMGHIDLLLQHTYGPWQDSFYCLQCTELLPLYNARACMVAVGPSMV